MSWDRDGPASGEMVQFKKRRLISHGVSSKFIVIVERIIFSAFALLDKRWLNIKRKPQY